MKNRIPSFPLTYVAILFCFAAIAGCAKKDDLTTAVAGRYTSGSGTSALEIIVTKVNNTTVAVFINNTRTVGTHGSCTMTSSTAITLNEATGLDNNKNERYEATGTGTLNGDSILIARHEKIFNNATAELKAEFDTTYAAKRR